MSSASSFVCSPALATAASACLLPPCKHGAAPSIGKLQGRRLSCRAMAGSGGNEDLVRRNIDRRDVLFGLTGFAAVATTNLGVSLAADGGAAAEPQCATVPITAEVLKCSSAEGFHCPAEYDATQVVDFSSLPLPIGPPRLRRAAHLMDEEYVKKFEDAIWEMKQLPDSDPRSYRNQAAIHEAYCDAHYKVVSSASPEVPFDVHYSSIFAPWHRMYIFFFERILGDLIGDPTFGLPYWNWDSPEGMIMPSIFADENSPLYNANRKPEHVRAFMDLNLGPAKQPDLPEPECTDDILCLIDNNLYSMYRQMTVDTPEEFHGGKFCTAGKKYTGSLENGAHTAAHIWVGQDMGNLRTAARDPVFYSNHSNVDRMWHLWSTKLGRSDLPYQEWLDTSFVFYDEKQRPVRIRVQDVLDTGKLGYTYQEKKRLEWMSKRPKPSPGIKRTSNAQRSATPASSFPMALKKGQNEYVTVERPEKAQAGGRGIGKAPEVLVLDLTVDPCEYAKFDVLVNVPRGQEEKVGPKNSEYAGSFTHVPHGGGDGGGMTMAAQEVSYRLKLREIIEDLKCGRDKRLDITIVPVAGEKTLVNSVRIDIL